MDFDFEDEGEPEFDLTETGAMDFDFEDEEESEFDLTETGAMDFDFEDEEESEFGKEKGYGKYIPDQIPSGKKKMRSRMKKILRIWSRRSERLSRLQI